MSSIQDKSMNEHKNQGLINTTVQHNDKIKNIENKVNLIVNNFANSSHVREAVEKPNRMEKHVYGAPVPHRSWRNLLLLVLRIGTLLVITIRLLRKHGAKWLVSALSGKIQVQNATKGDQVFVINQEDKDEMREWQMSIEEQLKTQNRMMQKLANSLTRDGRNKPPRPVREYSTRDPS